MANFTCSKCGRKTSGLKYTHEGRSYCYDCYQVLLKELQDVSQQKQELYSYIKKLYGVSELSVEVINMLDHELESGRKIRGIEYTLHYYHDILGVPVINTNKIFYIIRDHYDDARNYIKEVQKLKEHNSQVNLNVKPNIIHIDLQKAKSQRARKKIKYRIEDL